MDILYEELKGPAEAWGLVNPFLEAHKVDYPILMDDGRITKRYSVNALPVTYLIDRRRRIAATYVASWTAPTLKRTSKRFLPSIECNRSCNVPSRSRIVGYFNGCPAITSPSSDTASNVMRWAAMTYPDSR